MLIVPANSSGQFLMYDSSLAKTTQMAFLYCLNLRGAHLVRSVRFMSDKGRSAASHRKVQSRLRQMNFRAVLNLDQPEKLFHFRSIPILFSHPRLIRHFWLITRINSASKTYQNYLFLSF
jgi:hypothetical protein